MPIDYSKQFLSTLKDLSKISSQVVLKRCDGKVDALQKTADGSVQFHITSPEKNFNFETEKIAIYNFPEFYQFVDLFQNPNLTIEGNKIVIEENTSKSDYFLSNPEACIVGDEAVLGWKSCDVKFKLAVKELESIVKASALISSADKKKRIRIYGNGSKINIELVNININPKQKTFDKTFSRSFEVEKMVEEDVEYDFTINADLFINAPKKDYVVEVKKKGFVKSSYMENEINVDLFASFIRD
jgi:hypothetical protein